MDPYHICFQGLATGTSFSFNIPILGLPFSNGQLGEGGCGESTGRVLSIWLP